MPSAVQQQRQAEYAQIAGSLGMSQGALADLLEVKRETVNRRINGKDPITHEALLAVRYLQEQMREEKA